MTKWLTAPLAAAMVWSSGVQAQTPPASAPDAETTVKDITVVGGKIAPTTKDPKTATCEFLVTTDVSVRAQLETARLAGNPLFGPKIYQPTRVPINVDATATPSSPPGSALPAIGRQYRGYAVQAAASAGAGLSASGGADSSVGASLFTGYVDASRDTGAGDPETGAPAESSIDTAIDACRSFQNAGGSGGGFGVNWAAGKFEIAYRDKTLPTAFALFDEHRYAESLDYFQRAFKKLAYEHGGDEAALMIGKLYLGAPGVEQDLPKAVDWLKKAAGARFNPVTDMPQFDPREPRRNTAMGEAAMILGRIYQTGAGGAAKDPAQSRKWFERALWVGHVPAAAVLGDIYYYGADMRADAAKAFGYYKQGATLGHAPSQQRLGEMYYAGDAPGGRNLKLALAWHNEAAKIGHAPSLHALAMAYETGEGVAADPARALGLYKLAALSGSAAAGNALGTYFYDGRTVGKDPVLARRWFQRAALAGDADAMFNLGAMMMKGEGGELDRTRAWAWLKLAEKGDNPQAAAAVGVLEARMTSEERAQAVSLLAPRA